LLSKNSLKERLKINLSAIFDIHDSELLNKVCGAIASATIDEIKSNSLVKIQNVKVGPQTIITKVE
jgi:hypothetical protein